MIEYGKIDTLFERDERFSVTEVLKRPVFATIREWTVTEKIDGTNIRVDLRREAIDGPDRVTFGGRSNNAQLPADLIQYLMATFPVEKLATVRKDAEPVSVTLFGEGYGAGIQKGGGYRKDKAFILFDVLIADKWWLRDDAVTEIAAALGIPRVPIIGSMDLPGIVALVRDGFQSRLDGATARAEGVVARTVEPLFDNQGKRLVLKLKTCDWKAEAGVRP